jgi:ferritin-like metal-binding protein YciE
MATEIENLQDLYIDELKDLYNAESQITKALPKVIKKVTSPELKQGLQDHLNVTMTQIERLNQIFASFQKNPRGKKCQGMEGVLKEGEEVMAEKMCTPDLMDAALIGACQRVEHYEIAGYGTARAFAKLLGDDKAVDLLSQTLAEEKEADEKLSQIGMNIVNVNAVHEHDGAHMQKERMRS